MGWYASVCVFNVHQSLHPPSRVCKTASSLLLPWISWTTMQTYKARRASCSCVPRGTNPFWASRPSKSLQLTCTRQIGARTKSHRLASNQSTKVRARLPPRRSVWLTFFPYSPAAFDTDAWNTFPETYQDTGILSLPVPLSAEGPLGAEDPLMTPQGARIPIDSPIDYNSFSNMNVPMSREQMSHTADFDLVSDFGNTRPALGHLGHLGHIPSTNIGPSCLNDNTGWFINAPNLMMGTNPPSARANPLSWHGNAIAAGGENNGSSVPARNGLNNTTSPLRIRGKRSPPQTYEGDAGRLCDRLIREGADIATVMFLRYVIFEKEVTVDALLAPLQPSEVARVCDGANRMWEMLLETKEVMPDKKKYCCRLCPVGNRREYRHGHDAVRHFNRDHFGFSFSCEYW